MGDTIGKWEGDTLVADTDSFNDKTLLDRVGHVHSDALHVVERLRRIDRDTLEIEFTVDDPKAYTKPWSTEADFSAALRLESHGKRLRGQRRLRRFQ